MSGKSVNEDAGPVNCDVPHWLRKEQTTIYKGVEGFLKRLKALRG